MSKEIKILIYLVASAVLAYLCALFITLETDVTKWSNSGRLSLLMIWGILNVGLIIHLMVFYNEDDQ
jgi:Na+-translocating ferredoxin:NAD+ oxidoreductase RnfD subunit